MLVFLVRVILFVLLAALVRFVLWTFFGTGRRKVGAGRAGRFETPTRTITGHMVKDPQCGIYVASELALPLRTGRETLHFCSGDCRDAYLRAHNVKTATAP